MRIALLLLIASISMAAEIPGRYELHGEREVGSELVLDKSGRFEFILAYGAADFQSKGTWKADGGFVVLTADKLDAKPIRLVSGAVGKEPGVRVLVKGQNGRGVENIDVKVGEEQHRTDSEGHADFPEAKAPAKIVLHIPVYEVESEVFEFKAPNNELTFEINGEAITRVAFDKERLRVNGNALELRFYDKNKPMRYERAAP